ncbi:hypothetical protein TNCV_3790321 [Trichonephila clavipes]|nr:hypothetical protein TNCV_3790321 [Trichonephila clavipes]
MIEQLYPDRQLAACWSTATGVLMSASLFRRHLHHWGLHAREGMDGKRLVALYASSQGWLVWFPYFRHCRHVMNITSYTNPESTDIRFIYGLANGNGRNAIRLHVERYLTRW